MQLEYIAHQNFAICGFWGPWGRWEKWLILRKCEHKYTYQKKRRQKKITTVGHGKNYYKNITLKKNE